MRLATLSYIGEGGQVLDTAKSILINSSRVKSVQTITGLTGVNSAVVYSRLNDRDLATLFSPSTEATVRGELNTPNTTNNIAVIPLTRVATDLNSESGVKDFAVDEINWVEAWPDDATNSLVVVRNNDWGSTSYRVAEDVAAIKALAEA